eukprot:1662793-Prymnesium_polylepis.1
MAELSDYEQQRLANIAENHRMLASLGLNTAVQERQVSPSPSAKKKQPGEVELSEVQRAALSRADQWLERFEVWLRGQVSKLNADTTMARVLELVSGQGVHIKGAGRAFEGRDITIADDLVTLRQESIVRFGAQDSGGWHLRHPIGKLIKFQQ